MREDASIFYLVSRNRHAVRIELLFGRVFSGELEIQIKDVPNNLKYFHRYEMNGFLINEIDFHEITLRNM